MKLPKPLPAFQCSIHCLIWLFAALFSKDLIALDCIPQIHYIKITDVDIKDEKKFIPGTSVQRDYLEMETGVIRADGTLIAQSVFRRNAAPFNVLRSLIGITYTTAKDDLSNMIEYTSDHPEWDCWRVGKGSGPRRADLPSPLVDNPLSGLGGWPLSEFHESFVILRSSCAITDATVHALTTDDRTGELVANATTSIPNASPAFLEFFYHAESWQPQSITRVPLPLRESSGIPVSVRAKTTTLPPPWATHYGVRLTDQSGQPLHNCSGQAFVALSPPTFALTPCPAEIRIREGSTLSRATSPFGRIPMTKFRWFQDGKLLGNGPHLAGADTAKITLIDAQESQSGIYTVEVTNLDGVAFDPCEIPITVTVPPKITLQPEPLVRSDFVGTTMVFKVKATGTQPLKYQWRKDSNLLFNNIDTLGRITGVDTDTLVIDFLWGTDAGNYDVVVSNEAGQITSEKVTLTVLANGLFPGFVTPPNLQSHRGKPVAQGDDVVLAAKIMGSFPLTYQWRKDGVPIDSRKSLTSNDSSDVFHRIANVQASNTGVYDLEVCNLHGCTPSTLPSGKTTVSLVVHTPPRNAVVSGSPGPILSQTTVQLSAAAVSSLPLTYQWRRNGVALSDGGSISGATSATLSLANVQASDNGSYDVVVGNAAGKIPSNNQFALGVVPAPSFLKQPSNARAARGTTARFQVSASSSSSLIYQWFKDSSPLANGVRISGTDKATLSLADVTPDDVGNYHVVVTDSLRNSRRSESAALSVIVPPSFTQQPAGSIGVAGRDVQLSAVADGTAPMSFRWRKDGINLRNGSGVSGVETPSLSIANIQATDAGQYSVVVRNEAGNATSRSVNIIVEDPLAPQLIRGVTATATSEVTLYNHLAPHAVNGIRSDPLFWESAGVGMGYGEDRNPAITFDLGGPYRLNHFVFWNPYEPDMGIRRMTIDASEDGQVFTRIADDLSLKDSIDAQNVFLGGLITRFVRFTILENRPGVLFPIEGNPRQSSTAGIDEVEFHGWTAALAPDATRVTRHPQSRTLDAGQNVLFTTTATGKPPLTYQWLKDGAILANAENVSGVETPILTINAIHSANQGNYEVVVRGPGGIASSVPATLRVEDPLVPKPLQAIHATATSEMKLHGRLATNAINGIYPDSNFWQSVGVGAGFGEDRDPAITIELKQESLIDHMLIWNSHESGSDITRLAIDLSTDGIAFERIPGEFALSFNGAAAPQKLLLGSRRARFVRLDILELSSKVTFPLVGSPTGPSLAAIDEVEFHGWRFNGAVDTFPAIRVHPQPATAGASESVQFTVFATGPGAIRFQWRKDGTPLADSVNIQGAKTATLTLSSLEKNSAGNYDVVVSNENGSNTSSPALLTVETVSFQQHPANTTWLAGQPGHLSVIAQGTGLLTFQWRKNGSPLADNSRISGSTSATLAFSLVEASDAGEYDVVITSDGASKASRGARIRVAEALSKQDLLLYLPFAGNTEDASGKERHGTSNGAVLTTDRDGNPDAAYSFAGSQTIAVENLDPDGFAQGFSFGCWFKPAAFGGSPAYWVHDAGWGSTFVILESNTSLRFRLGSGNPATDYSTNGLTMPADQWHHFFITHNANFDRLYLNGIKVFENPSLPLQGNVSKLEIGPGFRGDLDEFVVFGRGLTESEVFSVFEGGMASPQDPPPDLPPVLTQQPTGKTVTVSSSVQFQVTASSTTPLTYQWRKDGAPIADGPSYGGSSTAILTLSNVQSKDAGSYDVIVSNRAGSRTSNPATLTVEVPKLGFVLRTLPGAFSPGQSFEVRLEMIPAPTVSFVAVADTPPQGWTVSAVSDGGVFDPRTGSVKFGPFADNANRTFKYTVSPPSSAKGRFEFNGIASADGTESDIGGAHSIENSTTHPADSNGDQRLVISEVTGYGAAWKRGESWAIPPSSIPVNYVTRAGLLWKSGELYRLDPSIPSAPLWWVPLPPATARSARHSPVTESAALRSIVEFVTRLQINPAADASSYAVEERLSTGFTATEISSNGIFLPADGIVRWGPFFDNQPRELHYRVIAPPKFEGELAVSGIVSVDGASRPIEGANLLRFGTTPPPSPVVHRVEEDRVTLIISGPVNARVLIETATSLTSEWSQTADFKLGSPTQIWSSPKELQEDARYYRVQVLAP